MGNNKRLLILSGAGAAIDWGGPLTQTITTRITADQTFRTIDGKSLGQYLIDKLRAYYHKQPELVNFETLLNCIEDLYSYFTSKYHRAVNKYKSNKPIFFDLKDDFYQEILDFWRIYRKDNHGKFIVSDDTTLALPWNDYDEFFQSVYSLYINIIGNEIKKYCKEKEVNSNKSFELNKKFKAYLKNYADKNYLIRYYTLNYDRLPAIISDIKFFEGFNADSEFAINKVLTDFETNSFYNLHGSVYLNNKTYNKISLLNEPLDIIPVHILKPNQEGDNILRSPLITGLKKTSQILNQPSHSFFNSFLYDYINADEIHFIGYSFSDMHVNEILNYPTKAEFFLVIDYIEFFKKLPENFLPILNSNTTDINSLLGGFPLSMSTYEIFKSNPEILKKINVYIKGFEHYLNETYAVKEEEIYASEVSHQ